jgi:hypothetical protein
VLELNNPDTTPIARGLQCCDAIPAPIIDNIIIDHDIVSMVANTRPRNSSDTCRSNWETFSTELTAIADLDIARKIAASQKYGIWLKITYDPPWIT